MKKNKITADIVKTAIVLLVFFIFANLAFAAPNSINIQGKLTNPSGTILTGTYNFSFSIYDAYTSGNKLYEANITSTTDARGVYDIILNNVNLSFSDQNYLGVKVNNDTEMSPRVNLTSVPYTFRANISDDLNKNNRYTITGLNITQGLNVTGGLRVSELASCDTIDTDSEGNFYCGSDSGAAASNPWNSSGSNVYQNLLHGSVGIGTASPYNTLTVIGSVGISGSLNASSINTTGSAYFATSSGSVGIGKTSPNYKLDVDGSINATNVTSEVVSAVQLNVGGGFSAGGLTISQDGTISTLGDILFSGNITVLKITHLKVNGSVLPDLDNNFDLGNGSFRWQNANFSGTVQAASFVGDGSSLTGISSSSDSSVWNFANNESAILDNDTIVRAGNTSFVSGIAGWTDDGTVVRLTTGTDSVGIGTTSPTTTLFVEGNVTIVGDLNITKGLNVTGGLRVSELTSCDTIDTDSEGNFYCGSDGGGGGGSDSSVWNFANNETLVLDNDTIIRTTNTTWWTNLYDATADRFGNSNFTARYDARTDRFGIENYSSEYSSTGFDNENFTTKYDERDDRYKEGNLSSDLSSGVASTISTTTLTSDTVIVNKNLYVIGNISNTDVTNLNINGSLYPALDNLFDLGNGSFRWRNGNLTGTLQAGTLSDGSATITGGVIDAPTIKILGSAVQVEASAFKISNFTSAYDARTDRFGRGNVTDYLGGSGSNASLIRSTNTTFFGLFSRVADAWNFANNESAILDNGTIIRTGNITGWDRSTADDWNFANNESAILDNDTIVRAGNTSFVTAISGWTDDGTVVRLTSGSDSVGIGTSTPSQELDVAGHINVTGTSSNSTFEGDVIIRGTLYGGSPLKVAGGINISSVPSGQDALSVLNSAGQKIFRISREGRLNVTRNAGNTTISSTLFIDAENNRVGVGKTSPTTALDVSGTVTATSFAGDGSSLSGIDTDFTNNSDINVTRFVATTATIDNLKVLTNFSYKILNGCYEDTSIDIEDTGTFCDALPSSNITSVRYADDSWKIQCCVPRDVCFTDSTVTPTDPSTVCNEKDINYSVTSLFYNSRSEWQANCCNDAGSCFEDLLITYGNESTICDVGGNTDILSINYDGSAWKTTCCERMIR